MTLLLIAGILLGVAGGTFLATRLARLVAFLRRRRRR